MIFYDFEVFKLDWLGVFIKIIKRDGLLIKEEIIVENNPSKLKDLYESNYGDVYVGFNNRHYDQYIFKGILLNMNPKEINDKIILAGLDGWQISGAFNKIYMVNYDVMPSNGDENTRTVGLKTMEGFLGSDIKETDVPFDIDRKLTRAELDETIKYCRHDVEQTIKVFMQTADNFNAMFGIVQAFRDMVSLSDIGSTEAQITAKVLGCSKRKWDDEFDWFILPCIRLKKYRCVLDWFYKVQEEAHYLGIQALSEYDKKAWYKSKSLTLDVAGIPHTFGFGGVHGATEKPAHFCGALYHVDVNNYYPSMLIAWDLVTRSASNDNYTNVYNTRKALKYKQKHAKTPEEARQYKKAQLPYKKMLNALSGGMKDTKNAAYDPRNNNCMCINGQLMLLDLIEHLEVIPGFVLIQSNTDGLIVQIPDTDAAFDKMDDICYEWEQRCSTDKCAIQLELDCIHEIYQKDVNNYLWIDIDGGVERIGAYLKELSPIDNDLPILNKALVEYMVHKIPVERTITECDDLIMFQKVVKLSAKYRWVEHEHCEPVAIQAGKRKIKTVFTYPKTDRYTYKSYRVFASSDRRDGRLLKCGGTRGKPEKFGKTPEHCFICNDSIEGVKIPEKLDKRWYIEQAKKSLKLFGITV